MTLSIIIVNYNVKAFLQNCLASIQKAVEKIEHEIFVVDNASDDGSVELIKKNYPSVKLIELKTNLGFSRANNIALAQCGGEFICIINPDTIVQENTFQTLIEFLTKNPEAGLVGCKILNPDGSLQLPCRRSFPTPWVAFTKVIGLSTLFPKSKLFSKYNLTYLDENQTYEVDAVSGSFMFLRKEVYLKVGGFDEAFFMYGEDLDFCFRIKENGYKVFYVHSTQIIHFKGESTKRSNLDELSVFYNAMQLFVKKHFSSSWLLSIILQIAIEIRKFAAFIGKNALIIFAVIVDIVLFNLTLLLSEIIYSKFGHFRGFPSFALPIVFTIPVLIFIIISAFSRAYEKKNLQISRVFLSIILSFLITSSLTYFFKQYAFSRAIILIQYLLLIFILPGWRIILKMIFKYPRENRRSIFESNTLIVGTNQSAIEIINKLRKSYLYYHDIIGLIDRDRRRIGEKVNDIEIIGSLDNLNKVIREKGVNEVIFATDFLTYQEMLKLVASNQKQSTSFYLVDSDYDFLVGKKDVLELEELPLIEIDFNISQAVHRYIKRILDLIISIPLLLLIYPVIYIYSSISKKKNKLLYLPLVVIGKYSIVGKEESADSSNIYLGKPGLTGIVQINQNKNLSKEERERLNIYYARNQNIWLDLEIILKSLQNFLKK
ncbi:MAG: glycosyltransferase [Ignavibacteria bacterium]|nr:glycosyltransferase [Ignavibacteria bacterium]